MIIVTGEIIARPETFDEIREIGLAHSRRSRAEPGCISHDLYLDGEQPLRLFFFERWTDMNALKAHFAVPESNDFMRAVRSLSAGGSRRPELYAVTEV